MAQRLLTSLYIAVALGGCTIMANKPNPDAPCPCGSGKLYRDCCGKDNK
ncbi:SEC-C metal-binding domain-containing protein [Candidatus Binatus sp.]